MTELNQLKNFLEKHFTILNWHYEFLVLDVWDFKIEFTIDHRSVFKILTRCPHPNGYEFYMDHMTQSCIIPPNGTSYMEVNYWHPLLREHLYYSPKLKFFITDIDRRARYTNDALLKFRTNRLSYDQVLEIINLLLENHKLNSTNYEIIRCVGK